MVRLKVCLTVLLKNYLIVFYGEILNRWFSKKKTLSFKTLRVESLLNALLVYLEIEKKEKKKQEIRTDKIKWPNNSKKVPSELFTFLCDHHATRDR